MATKRGQERTLEKSGKNRILKTLKMAKIKDFAIFYFVKYCKKLKNGVKYKGIEVRRKEGDFYGKDFS